MSDWINIETFYFHHLHMSSDDKIEILQSEFEIIKEHLKLYLTELYKNSVNNLNLKFLDVFRKNNPSSVFFINFNYTPTIDKYFNALTDVKSKMIINIHGNLYSKDNPIIFGYGDESNEKYKEIIARDKNKYLRNLKGQQYNLAGEYAKLYEILNSEIEMDIYIIGHSLGLTDKTLLKVILENPKVNSIKLYYYKDREGYRNLNDNIRRIIDNQSFNKVINFPNSKKIPQID